MLTATCTILFGYLKVRYEVGRDAPFRLDPGATSLTVGLDFPIFPFEHNVKVIQNRDLGNWRHWSRQFLRSGVKSTCNQGQSESEVSISPRLWSWAQAWVFTSQSLITHHKCCSQLRRQKKNCISSRSCVARTSKIGHDQAAQSAADVWTHQ